MNKEIEMKDVMQYMAWLMFNGFDEMRVREEEDLIPINSEQITTKRGVYLLVRSFE